MKFDRLAIAAGICALAGIGALHFTRGRDTRAPSAATSHRSVAIIPARTLEAEGEPKGFVIYFSDANGWSDDADRIARRLATSGYAVVGIDTSAFLAQLAQGRSACIHPVQPLMTIAQNTQRNMGWRSYLAPALAGHGLGATVVYATLAQAVPGIFLGGVSYDYQGFIPGKKPWCEANGYRAMRVSGPPIGWRPGPTRQLPTPWRLIANSPRVQSLAKLLAATPNSRAVRATSEEQGIASTLHALSTPADNANFPTPDPAPSVSDGPRSLPARFLRGSAINVPLQLRPIVS